MRRLALLATLVVLAGCHFPQGWHWPRTLAATGSGSTMQTVVYFQNDVAPHQWWLTQWIATQLDAHPELAIKLVASCPAGRNCVVWQTGDLNGAVTYVATGSDPHLVGATVILDDGIGLTETVAGSKGYVWHEACHALGGGFAPAGTGDAIHQFCNLEHRLHHMDEIARVYHNDPG